MLTQQLQWHWPFTFLFSFGKKILFSDEFTFDKVLKIVSKQVSGPKSGTRLSQRLKVGRNRWKTGLVVSSGNIVEKRKSSGKRWENVKGSTTKPTEKKKQHNKTHYCEQRTYFL